VRAAVAKWFRHQSSENLMTFKQVSRHNVNGLPTRPQPRKLAKFVITKRISRLNSSKTMTKESQ
jgi:hypothetical protein